MSAERRRIKSFSGERSKNTGVMEVCDVKHKRRSAAVKTGLMWTRSKSFTAQYLLSFS